MSNELIYIISVNWNNYKDTADFLRSLRKLEIPSNLSVKKVIVDNGSIDNSEDAIIENFPEVNVIKSGTNRGFAGGYNLGIKYAIDQGAKYLFILNNDVLIRDHQIILKLKRTFREVAGIGMISPKIYFAPGFEFYEKQYSSAQKGDVIWYAGGIIDWDNILFSHRGVDQIDNEQYNEIEETPFCTGCAIFTRSDILKKVGLFNTNYFAYLEDVDLNMRVKQSGYKLIYAGNSSIWHKTSRSSGGSGSAFHDYFMSRNRLIFGMRYASFRTKIALIREAIRLYVKGRKYQKLGIEDFFLGQRGPGRFFQQYEVNK